MLSTSNPYVDNLHSSFAPFKEAVQINDRGFLMKAGSAPIRLQSALDQSVAGAQEDGGDAPWLALPLAVTNLVNFVQFDAEFTSASAAEGLFTVWWNTNQIGTLDERVTEAALQTYRFALPGALSNGLYTLSFRLDLYGEIASSISVTNIATGFFGVTQPIDLSALSSQTGGAILRLTAAAGYSYLLESSTNLVNWAPAAVLINTNGTVLFEPEAPISSRQFYRALLP